MVPGESAIGLEPLAYNTKSTDTSVLRSQAISTKRIADALERIAAAAEYMAWGPSAGLKPAKEGE